MSDTVILQTKHRLAMVLFAAILLFQVTTQAIFVSAVDTENLDSTAETTQYLGGGAAVTNQAGNIGYATELYDSTNGLPTSGANTVLSTSDGFIWIGGYSGLFRYDGTSFQRQDSSGGITNANTLYEDSKGRLWIGTNDNGIVVLDNGTSKHYTYADGLPTSTVRTITEDGKGNILVGMAQGIAVIDENMELKLLDDTRIKDAYILRLVSDNQGIVYGITRDGTIFYIKDLQLSATFTGEDLNVGEISTIYPDPLDTDMVYFGTNANLVCHGSFSDQFQTMEKISTPSLERIHYITYASNRIWLLSDVIVGYLDENNEYQILQNLPVNSGINSLIVDYEDNLWISSDRQGVLKIVANKFTDLTGHAALEPVVVNATCLHDGSLYIGTDTGLQILDKDFQPVENKLTKYIGDSRIRCIIEDTHKNLWLSTYTDDLGLVCYTANGKIKSFTVDNGLISNETRSSALASDGSILEATNAGLSIIKDGKIIKNIGADSGISNTVFLTTVEGNQGKYYIGTDGGGIYIVDGDQVTHLGREDGLTSDVILRIKKDQQRNIYWIITSNSIAYMEDEKITTIDTFPYNNNYDIYFDENDNAWILASSGIYVVKTQEMIDNPKFDYLFYDASSGLPSLPTGNSFSDMDQEGNLYIAGRSGVIGVNINQYFEQTHDIKLTIPYIDADGKRFYLNSKNRVTIPSSSKVVTIFGYALTYSMQNPTMQYFLDGVDGAASFVTKQDMEPVRYTNLPGGEYSYELALVNTSTHNIQQAVTITIAKQKAFYEELWFQLLCVVIILLCIARIIQIYISQKTKALLKKDQENKTFIREMIEAFAKTIDMKDRYTNGHSSRVAKYTVMLAKELGYDDETVEKYYNIALLHDIGKIGIPSAVLNKPGKLTDEEFKIIKSHSGLGYHVLKDISIMPELAIGAGAHHERPDGKGYPKGLTGDQIPRVAQIIAVADTFDAMYSDRPYRKRMNFEKAVSIIRDVSGTQLTSDVVDAFLRLVEKGEFKDPEDTGNGSMEDIDNIHKKFDNQK